MEFQAVAWEGEDVNRQYYVRVYGRSASGKSVCVTTPFNPYFFVKISKNHSLSALSSAVTTIFYGTKVYEVMRRDVWGFQNGDKSRFACLEFQTHSAFRNCQYGLSNIDSKDNRWNALRDFGKLKIYEANLDPVLRFMHVTGIRATGWLSVPNEVPLNSATTCNLSVTLDDWRLLKPVERDDIAPLKIMSLDIECYSSTGAFPSPHIPGDVCFQIGMTTMSFGSDVVEKKCLCLRRTEGHEWFDTERAMLEAFQNYLIKTDPDIITGWNIFGFDLEFLIVRAGMCNLERVWGRFADSKAELVIKKLSSSALGSNEMKLVPMRGRYVFDLYLDVQREHKLESYSLNNVSRHFLKDEEKIDMPVKEIFRRYQNGTPEELKEVADYCIQDTILPHLLLRKLCQIQNVVAMASACWVPMAYLSERGQQIKVFSQMAKKARELGFLIPTTKFVAAEPYQGATVLEAQSGAYYEPVTTLDFASLYPSIMTAYNLCYSAMVMNPAYDNLPGVTYLQFGEHRFAQDTPSLLPPILMELGKLRKEAKKNMAAAKGTPMEAVYNGQQLAYKLSMNSVYGFCGASAGILPLVPIAASVTMQGRSMIEQTRDYVEKNFEGAKVRYGDSVMPYTPVMVTVDGVFSIKKIEDLADEWQAYDGFLKPGSNKESSEVSRVQAWTHLGWMNISRVIRHKCLKKIFRVLTPKGLVDVTEDHSLLTPDVQLVKPGEIQPGTRLHHKYPDIDYPIIETFDYPEMGSLEFKSQVLAQEHFTFLQHAVGLNAWIETVGSDFKVCWTTLHINEPQAVVSVHVIHESWDGYVYDLETEAGSFQAGIGQMIVKNTDSVMIQFNLEGRKGQEALDYSWQQGLEAAKQCTALFKAPNKLELEKIYCPYILYSKKRYAAKMWEMNDEGVVAFSKIDIKGLQVVRRDSCPFVRETLKSVLDLMLESNDPRPAIKLAKAALQRLRDGEVPTKELLMSKKLAGSYKSQAMPHLMVTEKIRKRSPGSEPRQGDRVPYLIIKGPGRMCDKAEDPAWVAQNKLKIDYKYYETNQFVKPVSEMLEPLVGDNPKQIFEIGNQQKLTKYFKT